MRVSIESLLDQQFRRWEHDLRQGRPDAPHAEQETPVALRPVVTVSRAHGSRGAEVAAVVATRFGYTLLHRDLIDRISASTGYTRRLLAALDERTRSRVTQWVDSMLNGRLVDEADYVSGLLQTLRSIARLGGVVVVGRGANFVMGPESGLHVRVVAPREDRIAAIARRRHLTESEAAHEVDGVDHARRGFVRRLFGREVDDPLGYDLVLNDTGWSVEALAGLVVRAAEEKFARLRPAAAAVVRER